MNKESIDAQRLYGRPWAEHEYLLVLDSYIKNKGKQRGLNSDFIVSLSQLLGRTRASILMRMENFAGLDSDAGSNRKGLQKGGSECARYFREWIGRVEHLQATAEVLRRSEMGKRQQTIFNPDPISVTCAFDRYELLDNIGKGGFGEIYSCIDRKSGEMRAIKIIQNTACYDEEARGRFVREIRFLKEMNHDRLIKIYDDNLDEEPKMPAFVMELAEENLDQYVKTHGTPTGHGAHCRIATETADKVFISIAEAIIALHTHRQPMIHRDVNPANILRLPDERWVLADFGLAKYLPPTQVTSFLTQSGIGLGTQYFASPEQYSNLSKCDERTDIYALGMLLWYLFSEYGPPPDRSDSGLTPCLKEIFVRATERQQDKRYGSAKEMVAAFIKCRTDP